MPLSNDLMNMGVAGAYYGMQDRIRQRNEESSNNQLRQLSGVMSLQQMLQAQGQKQEELKRQNEFRTAIAGAKTPEEKLEVASRYMDPNQLGSMIQTAQTRKDTNDQTRQIALSRLQQTAQRDMMNMQEKVRTAQTNQEKFHWAKEMSLMDRAFKQQAAEIAAGRYTYDTGGYVPTPFPGGVQAPAATQAPAQGGIPGSPGFNLQSTPQVGGQPITNPQEAAAANAVLDASARGEQMSVTNPAGSQPFSVPAQAAQPAVTGVIPPTRTRIDDQIRLQQNRGSIAGTGSFTPQALNFVAKQYLTGDRQAVQGFARNATARIALQNEIVDEAGRQGLSPSQTAAKMAEFAGTVAGSRTVGQRAANISLAATEAQEMLGIVKETSDKFGRTNFVPWNMALRAYESGTGEPEIAEFGAAVNALVNVYARAINPTGVPTVSDKEHARAVLNTVQSPAQVQAVLGIINRELEIAKKAPSTVRSAISGGITGQQPTDPSADRRIEQRTSNRRVIVDY